MEHPAEQLYISKGLMLKGIPVGYKMLYQMVTETCQANTQTSKKSDEFITIFRKIFSESLTFISKERGYESVFKFYEQRLFSTI